MDAQLTASRFRLALDLFATGEAMMRQRLRRLNPQWGEDLLASAIQDWLRERPGAEAGDAEGRPVAWTQRSG
jgi:hypothetical protein